MSNLATGTAQLTQAELKKVLHYNPDTGVWTRIGKTSPLSRVAIGLPTGTKNKAGYVQIWIARRCYLAHRLVFLYIYGAFPPNEVDHINGTKDDNRRVNLRRVDSQTNGRNTSIPSTNTSGIMGVSWHKASGKWGASINTNKKHIHLGVFARKADAAKARKDAEEKLGFHANHGRAS